MSGRYRFDTHVHTSETSACGKVSGRDVAWCYRAAGYQGIMITDHYHKAYFDSLGQVSAEEKVEAYLTGYREAKAEGDRIGLDVILGMEFRNTETDDDFLIIGVTEEFLYQHPLSYELPLSQAIELFHQNGMLVIQAHPVRFAVAPDPGWEMLGSFRNQEMLAMTEQYPDMPRVSFSQWSKQKKQGMEGTYPYPLRLQVCSLRLEDQLDGIEVYNGNFHWTQSPEEIRQILERHPEYIKTSGSDYHEAGHLARGGIWLSRRARTADELRQALTDGCIADWICS